jgi:hypothetical protein
LHRAEVLRVRGRLDEAEREGEAAVQLLDRTLPMLTMFAHAELGEVRRRRGDPEAALSAFGRAVQLGWDPQPGMALVLLATGHGAEALRAIERVFRARGSTFLLEDKANLLCARTTVALANAEVATAHTAADELAHLAHGTSAAWDQACSAEARGRLELDGGHVERAIDQVAHARRPWTHIDALFELATAFVLLREANSAAGDAHQAQLAFEAARVLYGRMGALRGDDGAERRLAGLVPSASIVVTTNRGAVPGASSGTFTGACASSSVAGASGGILGASSSLAGANTVPAGASSSAVGANSGAVAGTSGGVVDVASASLVREGDYWSVCFAGRTLRLRDGRGVQYLAELIARPGEQVWAVELASGPGDGAQRAAAAGGDTGPLLDARARQEYSDRMRLLEDELADARECADARREESAGTEMVALGRELSAAVGRGGRDRESGAAAERAPQSVTKAIRALLKKIESEHEALGEHLNACVRTGTACAFQPDRRHPVAWSIERGG